MYQQDNRFSNQEQFKCKLKCCRACTFCQRAITKERCKSRYCNILSREIKICEKCFFCHSLVLCTTCKNVKNVAATQAVGTRLQSFWQTWLDLGAGPKVVQILKEGYTLPFRIRPRLTRYPTVISRYVNPHRNSYLLEALHQLIDKNAVELVQNQVSLGFYNRLFLVPKPNNKWRPILDLSKLNLFLKVEKFKMETPETIRTSLQMGEWVTSIDFKDTYFHIPIQEQSRKYLRFHVQGQTYQFRALPFGLSTAPLEFTVVAKEVKLMALHKGIRIHQYLDDWLVRATSHQACLQHTKLLIQICQDLGWLVNLEKSELEPKQVFDFVGYQFDLQSGRVRPTPERWQNLQQKILGLLSLPTCPVREFMSLIGLLTATEKQVHLGRLHMRPIQWHLKNNWRTPESLEKVIPIPRSLHPHLQWWLAEKNVLTGQPLHPLKHALQIFTDASKEGWGAHLNEHTARGTWSLPESKLHINYLELKAVFLALKEFQSLCSSNIVLVATDNTTVVSYINKEGGMRSGTLCALLWRILTINISKDENLTRLLDSFHRDRPKGRRGIPSWNLSLVLHQLTKAPFEPLKEASLKHLTFKTVFLLALGSGKRRSEIHAWQNKNIRHQSDWSKVSLYPSPSFLSKNQLAKEGPESVAPVVIPALAPTLDRSLKSDRSLCPVRALRYYLDRTSDLRQNKELVFVSFKKGFDKDISPATISSWIKQTVILCYELSDQESHTLHQVKAHDIRAFAASKAFQSGVSLEQILSACHWKSHNTFTQFYLKDVAWADSELYHLGPVVAAQQIHQQAST